MSDAKRTEQRERVLEAAARLFAQKGYGGTGMRALAREAGVSLSMINYYFGSKQGVFEQLLDQIHDRYFGTVRRAIESEDEIEGKVRAWVRGVVGLARRRGPEMRMFFIDLPAEVPGVLDRKARRIEDLIGLMTQHVFGPLGREKDMPFLGPGIGSMIMSHFMARPMIEHMLGGLPDDDAFYDRYADIIAHQLLYGLMGTRPSP